MSKTRLSCTEYVLRIKHEFLNVGFENKLYVRTVLLIIDSINSNFNPFQKARPWDFKPNNYIALIIIVHRPPQKNYR